MIGTSPSPQKKETTSDFSSPHSRGRSVFLFPGVSITWQKTPWFQSTGRTASPAENVTPLATPAIEMDRFAIFVPVIATSISTSKDSRFPKSAEKYRGSSKMELYHGLLSWLTADAACGSFGCSTMSATQVRLILEPSLTTPSTTCNFIPR